MTNTIPGLHIGLDGYNLALSRGTGVATYARTLSRALKEMGCSIDILYGMNIHARMPEDLREVTFFDSLGEEKLPRKPKIYQPRWFGEARRNLLGHAAIEVPMSGRVKTHDFAERMPAYDRILNVPALFRAAGGFFRTTGLFLTVDIPDPPEIMHWTYPLPIRLKGAKNIYTVHDLVPLTMPHTTLDNKDVHFRLLRKIMAEADGVCTVSEYAKNEILSYFPKVAPKLYNTYQSFSPSEKASTLSHEAGQAQIRSLFDLQSESYYLYFGSLEPKKNIGRIIESFLTAKTDRKLVLVGAMAWKSENELRFLETGIRSGRIIHLQYLPQTALLALIQNAFAVLFPSLTEGFGLPVLEALFLGTAVITSREASLPEVGGDACLYVDAYRSEDITSGIETLETDPGLRATLRGKAKAQAAKFSMAEYEKRLSKMYASVMGRKL